MQRRISLLPLAFALLLAVVGWVSLRLIEETTREQVRAQLETILDANLAALEIWVGTQRAIVDELAQDPEMVQAVQQLAARARAREDPAAALRAAPDSAVVAELMGFVTDRHRYLAYRIFDPSTLCLASSNQEVLGQRSGLDPAIFNRVLGGETLITPPLPWDDREASAAKRGAMALFAPVRDPHGRVIAALGLGIDAEENFSRPLEVARAGETGETYAFAEDGTLLSESRFEDQLRAIGLLPRDPSVQSFMNVQIRDPGGDMSKGHRPDLPIRARPFTRMAAAAIAGGRGVDVDGYRDYRGVEVVGAWAWLPELGLGIATEMDRDEAYRGFRQLQLIFLPAVALLVLAAAGLFAYAAVVSRLGREIDQARQLGRYRIERMIGRGGMGTVYLASHALLRRPTAVKLLRPEHSTSEALARFEREVQVTSALTHPNTIAVYDYGRTPKGVFYYAMEYLDGITLAACVEHSGALPEPRVLHILKQVCGSVAEAHEAGLVHRDLKPSNVMLCRRGGMEDFVKVLDFGLVREVQQSADVALTDVQSLTGTPLYMPPEAIEAAGAQGPPGDLYQIGAIGYFLLTGRNVFEGDSTIEVLAHHRSTTPTPPSEVLGKPLDGGLEALILRCLEKRPEGRPAIATEMLRALESIDGIGEWSPAEAERWWAGYREAHPHVEEGDAEQASLPSVAPGDLLDRLRGAGGA